MEFQEKGARRRNIPDKNKTRRQACPKKRFAASGRDFALDASENRKVFNRLFAHIQHPVICYLTLSVLLCFLICCYSTTIRLRCQSFFAKFSDKSFDMFSAVIPGKVFQENDKTSATDKPGCKARFMDAEITDEHSFKIASTSR